MMRSLPVVVCAAAVLGLLWAERSESRLGIWLAKPLAVGGYLWAAVGWGALETTYGRWLLLGLVLCGWGDVLLIPKRDKAWFRAGMIAFLGGHLGYIVAFLHLPRGRLGLAAGVGLAIGLAWWVRRWLGPKLPTDFRRLVGIYVVVICAMLTAAYAAADGSGLWTLALGALLFALSDLTVARDRFIAREFINRAWGLPLYFAAQLLLASTVAD